MNGTKSCILCAFFSEMYVVSEKKRIFAHKIQSDTSKMINNETD